MPDFTSHFGIALAVALVLDWLRTRTGRQSAPMPPSGERARASVVSRPGERAFRATANDPATPGPLLFDRLLGAIWRSTAALFIGFLGSAFLAGMIEQALDVPIPYGSPRMLALLVLVTVAAWALISGLRRS